VRSRVVVVDDENVLSFDLDQLFGRNHCSVYKLVLLFEQLHGEIDAFQLASGNRQITRLTRTDGQTDRMILAFQLFYRNVAPDKVCRSDLVPLCLKERKASIDDGLLQLEVGDAKTHVSACSLFGFKYGDRMARSVEKIGGGKAGRARSDDGDLFAGALLRG